MSSRSFLRVSLLAAAVLAQQPGPLTPEVHPPLVTQKCTKSGGCTNVNSSIVLDSQYRWLHSVKGYDSCRPNGWDATLCPNEEACAANCAVEGVDYASYGIATSGDAVTLNLYVSGKKSSPRVYLLQNETNYDLFMLKNQEFTFDVDMSKLPCGINGALYFSNMDGTGNANELNKAGAKYGTGYCDAQCPGNSFIRGYANLNGTYGACCPEMDIWEANSAATAYTPHPCTELGLYPCSGDTCGNQDRYGGVCDKDGCDFNSYRQGAKTYIGVGSNNTIDSSKKLTVVTQFITDDGTAAGTLTEIRRLYVQNGKVFQNSKTSVAGVDPYDSITDGYCTAQKTAFNNPNDFAAKGGMASMGRALDLGMVLAFSIWDDSGSYMLWLDSTFPADSDSTTPGAARGPCATTSGRPDDNAANYPDAAVTWSNVKIGDLDSTYTASSMRRRDVRYA